VRILAHMAKIKYIPEVIEAFLNCDKGDHEVNYLITDYNPFKDDLYDLSLQMSLRGRTNIAYKMEAARSIALKNNYQAIFNVEDDNLIPKDALLKLVASDKNLISGMYRYRVSRKPHTPLMPEKEKSRLNFKDEDLNTGVREAYLIPWGCTLFKRDILKRFSFTPELDGGYMKTIREAGVKAWVETSVHVGHYDVASDGSMIRTDV